MEHLSKKCKMYNVQFFRFFVQIVKCICHDEKVNLLLFLYETAQLQKYILFSHLFGEILIFFFSPEFPGYSCLLHDLILGPWSPRTEFLRQEQSWINQSAYDLLQFEFTKSDERSTQIWKCSTFLECTVFCTMQILTI